MFNQKMDDLESCLSDLIKHFNDPIKVETIICKISQFFMEEQTHPALDLMVHLVLAENGIISFIKKVILIESNKLNILSAFELLEFLLVNFEKSCIPYAEDIKSMCLCILECGVAAKIKENSMKLLKCALSSCIAAEMDAGNIILSIKNYIEKNTAIPPTVEEQLLCVAGIIFERAPESAQPEKDWFSSACIGKMKALGAAKEKSSIKAGCLQCLNGYLINFEMSQQQLDDVYNIMKNYCESDRNQTKRVISRIALKIIKHHYRIFALNIYRDLGFWRLIFSEWTNKTGEDKQLGFGGLVSVYRAVSYVIDELHQVPGREMLENTVEELLNNRSVHSVIGLVELISTGHVNEDLVNRALKSILKQTNQKSEESLVYLSVNLECISKYLSRSKSIKPSDLIHLKRLAVRLIDEYPKMDSYFQKNSLTALEKSFYNVNRCGRQEFDEYTRDVIYHGLIRSCSHPLLVDVELEKELTGRGGLSYKSYLPLWRHVINLSSSSLEVESFEFKSNVSTKVFDTYVYSFLRMNKKLDLGIEVKNQYATDPELSSEAQKPEDFKIFINNVCLFEELMDACEDAQLMKKWLIRIFDDMIDSCYNSPLVSGFYKVVAACLKIADKLRFFRKLGKSDRGKCFESLQRFLQHVSAYLGQFKGDLQISCFRILLSAPASLVNSMAKELIPTFETIASVGSGHFPLLTECLDTLERWCRELSKESAEYLLRRVLPHFDLFLQSRGAKYLSEDHPARKRRRLKAGGKVARAETAAMGGLESQLLALQRRFLLFLGTLDQDVCMQLIRSSEDGAEDNEDECEMDECGPGNGLVYDLPLNGRDSKMRLRLDAWLPRVTELALSSSDRSTRITACELLHSMVLMTIGGMRQTSGRPDPFFRKMLSTCLLLGCDSDHVVFQIYESILMQMARYFAAGVCDFSVADVFAGVLAESVSHSRNSSLKDLAARLIREFTEWSIKSELASTEPRDTPYNVKNILRRIYSLSIHPDHSKRCGAAIIFNNIYSLISEDTHLINTHWFQLYYHFMESLNRCSACDDTKHIVATIERIAKLLMEKNLNEKCNSRIVPPGFKNSSPSSLMEWTFKRCSYFQTKVRKLSMSIIEDLSCNLKNCASVKEFVNMYIKEEDIGMKPSYLSDNAKEDDYLQWMKYNSALFDYYNWLLVHNVITEVDLNVSEIPNLMSAFLDEITQFHRSYDSNQIASTKASAIVNFLEFLSSSIYRKIYWYQTQIFELIKTCLFRPSAYKFYDKESYENLEAALAKLIPHLDSWLAGEELSYVSGMDDLVPDLSRAGECSETREAVFSSLGEVLNGLKMIHNLRLWDSAALGRLDKKIRGDEVIKRIFNFLFVKGSRNCCCIVIEASEKFLLDDLMRFGMKIGATTNSVLNLLMNKEEVINEETYEKITKGDHFLELFKDCLFDYFILNFGSSQNLLVDNFSNAAPRILLQLLEHADRSNLPKSAKEEFVSAVFRMWPSVRGSESENDPFVLLSVIRAACRVNANALAGNGSICRWILGAIEGIDMQREAEIVFELAPFLSPMDEDLHENDALGSSLMEFFRRQHFLVPGADSSDPKIAAAYAGLLSGFRRNRSLVLLRCLMKLAEKHAKLVSESDLEDMSRDVCQRENQRTPDSHLKKILLFLYKELFFNRLDCEESNGVYELFMDSILKRCKGDFAWSFLLENIEELMTVFRYDEHVLTKTSAMKIIQSCIAGVGRELLENWGGKKEAFRDLINVCSKVPGQVSPNFVRDSEPFRKYFCACFNTLCTIIVAKTDDPRQFKCIIFKDNFSFLSHIVNRKKPYALGIDFDTLPKRKKILNALRRDITRERQLKLDQAVNSVKYLQDQTLFASSLQEDVTKFDFSTSYIRPMESVGAEIAPNRMELEMDAINDHECMATLIALVEHMVEARITPPPAEDSEEPLNLPFWLSSIVHNMTSFEASENEKIFLLKLTFNIDKYVRPYGKKIVKPLLDTILELFQEKPINYLIIDLIYMILNWRMDMSNLDVGLEWSNVALYIINNSDSFRKDIMQSNLEVAKLIVETCKDGLNAQRLSSSSFERLHDGRGANADAAAYLNFQFCYILLANSIPPWTKNMERKFLETVLCHCREGDKNCKYAAEVCGLSLKFLQGSGYGDMDGLVAKVRDVVRQNLMRSNVKDLTLLYGFYRNYPRVVSFFVDDILSHAWIIGGPFKVQSLEMLLSYVTECDSVKSGWFESTIDCFLRDMLSSDDPSVLEVVLRIVESVLVKMEYAGGTAGILEKVLPASECRNARVRKAVYNVAIGLFQSRDGRLTEIFDAKLIRGFKAVLLRGMNDAEGELSEKCLQFWYDRLGGINSRERFLLVMDELYAPETEDGFLGFVTRMVIKSATSSGECDKFVFEHPLVRGSSFRRKNILVTTARHSTIAPMFAQSVAALMNKPESLQSLATGPNLAPSSQFHSLVLKSIMQNDEGETETEGHGQDSNVGGRIVRHLVRDPDRARAHFAKKHAAKRKAELEVAQDRARKMGGHVEIIKRYSDGDFPDIQVTHSDILKTLEALARADPQMERHFMVSVYDSFVGGMTNLECREVREKLSHLVARVTGEGTLSDPTLAAFIFHVLISCGGSLDVDTGWIAKFAKSSGWLSAGGFLIEEMIAKREGDEFFGSKKKGLTPDERRWLDLADLCRCMKEFQVLRGIFLDKLRVVGDASEAIRSESVSDWSRAAILYESVLRSPSGGECFKKDFYEEAYLTSLAHLSDWSKIKTYVASNYEFDNLWSDPRIIEKILPWYVRSETVGSMLTGESGLLELIAKSQRDPEKERCLKELFAEELAIGYFSTGDIRRCNLCIHNMWLRFLSSWSHWNKWSNNLRASKLLQLQLISEIQQCLSILGEKSASEREKSMYSFIYLWCRNCPRERDDLMTWDVKLTCRDYFLSKMLDSDSEEVKKSAILSEFQLIRSGIAQQNFRLSQVYLSRIEKKLQNCRDHEVQLLNSYYKSTLEILREEKINSDENEKMRKMVDALSRLQRKMSLIMGTDVDRYDLFYYECNSTLSRAMGLMSSAAGKVSPKTLDYVANTLRVPNMNRKMFVEYLKDMELEYLKKAKSIVERADMKEAKDLLADMYVQIAKYHRRRCGYNKDLAKCIFRSMALGNPEAKSLFCCLLNEPRLTRDWESDPELKNLCRSVPPWMYLTWTNQILANLDSEMFPFLSELLRPLADEYPNAVRYPLGLSRENYRFVNSRCSSLCRRFVHELSRKLLSDVNYENFVTALSYVAAPDLVLRYYMEQTLLQVNQSQPNWSTIQNYVRGFCKQIYEDEFRDFRGPIFNCLTPLKPQLEDLLQTAKGCMLWNDKIKKIKQALSKMKVVDSQILNSFCPWLHNFPFHSQDSGIEIPGQYGGVHKPILKYQVMISSIKCEVSVMNSKCKPIRITILGNDARNYRYLIKFGEDLRQDQRIQQIFDGMNRKLIGNCHGSQLRIDTYNVIPLRSNLGMIEWVNNTMSLHELLTKSNPTIEETMRRVQQEHLKFLAQNRGSTSMIAAHLNGYLNIERDRAVARFNERVNSFEWDNLRKAFWQLTSCPDHFVHMRKNFAVSLAAMYCAHWILGIGDRHLGNILVSAKSGRALGIDFGCSFGFATEFLTPPELVPFRLTPQIINLMKPMGESGFIKETMSHCFRCLRLNHCVLLAMLEVFVLEPSLNWLEHVMRNEKSPKEEDIKINETWRPQDKIATVKDKLNGVNPIKIFRDDLTAGHSRTKFLSKYLEVLDGVKLCPKSDVLTEEEQVECLIELATDRHVLSKTYVGWNPWL